MFPEKSVTEIYKTRVYKNNKRGCPEVFEIVYYKNKVICITTKGDNYHYLKEQIDKFIEVGYNPYTCDLFICASLVRRTNKTFIR